VPKKLITSQIEYNGLVVIQSLGENEQQTGQKLYEDIISRRCDLRGHGKYFYDVNTKQEFFNALDQVFQMVVSESLRPIIHFEMHGFLGGVAIKNGERVIWTEFVQYCRLINVVTKNQLIITLATCWGSEIARMIDITQPAPYWGYLGPKEEISSGDLLEDFGEFYDSLLTEGSFAAALNTMVLNNQRGKYIHLHAKGIFEYHIEKHFEGTKINKKEAFKRLAGNTKENYPALNRADRRKKLKANIKGLNRGKHIASLKKVFLMLN
jgi:hypothetical protein